MKGIEEELLDINVNPKMKPSRLKLRPIAKQYWTPKVNMICNSPVRLHSNKYGTVKVWREKKKKKKNLIWWPFQFDGFCSKKSSPDTNVDVAPGYLIERNSNLPVEEIKHHEKWSKDISFFWPLIGLSLRFSFQFCFFYLSITKSIPYAIDQY